MSQGRHGIKVLGLSLIAALGLMAFTAAAAQAGEFSLTNGTPETTGTFTAKGVASESIEGSVALGELLVPGLGISFHCTGGNITGTVLLKDASSKAIAHANILYTGCTVKGNKFCQVYETHANMLAETNVGNIAASGLGELILMGGQHYLLVESASFATLYLLTSAKGCTLPLENAVNGSTVLFIPNALTQSQNQTLIPLTQAELETLFPNHKLFYGTQAAWLDGGTATVALSGVNKGKKWGGE